MKKILTILLACITIAVHSQTNHYLSATGSDAANGLTPGTAWKTIPKLNSMFSGFAVGDSVLFKCGDTFYGSILVNKSGTVNNPIVLSSYGTGAKPLISGFTTLSSWTLLSTGIYTANVTAKATLNIVTVNGVAKAMGRFPNRNAANAGYLLYKSFVGTTSITDRDLTGSWIGAKAGIRKSDYEMNDVKITNQVGKTLSYTFSEIINPIAPLMRVPADSLYGYFIYNHPATLDTMGEWWNDTVSHKLRMFFGSNIPTDYVVKVATVDTLLNMNGKSNLRVDGLAFEGAGMSAIYGINVDGLMVINSAFYNMGKKDIHLWNVGHVDIENDSFATALQNSIQVRSPLKAGVKVIACVFDNIAPFEAQGCDYDGSDNITLWVNADSVDIEYNVLSNFGYSGIAVFGSHHKVYYNIGHDGCKSFEDGAFLYTHMDGTDAKPGSVFTDRKFKYNIAYNMKGQPVGTPKPAAYSAFCFYADGRSANYDCDSNVFFNSTGGITMNAPKNARIRGNVLFNIGIRAISFTRWTWGNISNLVITNNVIAALNEQQEALHYQNTGLNTPYRISLMDAVKSLGLIDSNYYTGQNDEPIVYEIKDTANGPTIRVSPQSPTAFNNFCGFESHRVVADRIPNYNLVATIGASKAKNGSFTTNMLSYIASGVIKWDNTSKISGAGSLKYTFATPVANSYSFVHSPVDGISIDKKYILRFKTLGTTVNGIVKVYIRKTGTPYNQISTAQIRSFGTSVKAHEFYFDSVTTVSAGSIVIAIEQNSGTTYVDDVEFYEVNANRVDIATQIGLIVNNTAADHTSSLAGKFKNIKNIIHNGFIVQPAFTGDVIYYNGLIEVVQTFLESFLYSNIIFVN